MSSIVLSVDQLRSGYGGTQVLRDVSLTLRQREVVGIIGPNGAGKTTLLRTIGGLLALEHGKLMYEGGDISRATTLQRRLGGISYVPQERNVFPNLSVLENLEIGYGVAGAKAHGPKFQERLDFVYGLFPRLAERKAQRAGLMSGGEQRMVAIGIGLMLQPTILMLDEPTTGLAPHMVHQLMTSIRSLSDVQGISILLVEQNIISMLEVVDRLYLVKDGRCSQYEGDPKTIGEQNIWEYL
jgi:branched-chain amino acid transport system ATP-binding protein